MSTRLIKQVEALHPNPLNFGSVIVSDQKVPALSRSMYPKNFLGLSQCYGPFYSNSYYNMIMVEYDANNILGGDLWKYFSVNYYKSCTVFSFNQKKQNYIVFRSVQYLVWTENGPKTNLDRTGRIRSGRRSSAAVSSVFGPIPV